MYTLAIDFWQIREETVRTRHPRESGQHQWRIFSELQFRHHSVGLRFLLPFPIRALDQKADQRVSHKTDHKTELSSSDGGKVIL